TRTAVNRFIDANTVPVVDAGGCADSADQARSEIAQQVAIKIAGDQHLELFRLGDELHAAVINNHLFGREVRKLPRSLAKALQKKPVSQLQDVRLMNTVDGAPALAPCQREGKAKETPACRLRHDFKALHHSRHNLMLDGGIKIFRDFADEQDIYVAEPRRQPREVSHRPDRCKETQLAAKLNVEIRIIAFGWIEQ